MPEISPQKNVPESLRQREKQKKLAEEKAKTEIHQEIKKGETFLCAIGYISFLCVLPLVLLRDSQFGQFHGKQALVLAIFIYFLDIIEIFPPLVASLYTLLKTGIVIYAIVMSFQGKYFRIPFVYPLSERFNIAIRAKENAEIVP